jgi:rod shape-determining protein MreD
VRYYLAAAVLLVVIILQTSVVPAFSLLGAHPNVVLVLAVCWAMVRGQGEALVVVPMAGIGLGLVDGQPVGTALLALIPVVLLAELKETHIVEGDFLLALGTIVVATLAYETVFLVTLWLAGETIHWWDSFSRMIVPTAIVNTLLMPPLYGLMWLASSDLRRASSF